MRSFGRVIVTAFIVLGLLTGVLMVQTSRAQSQTPAEDTNGARTISVSGSGTAYVQPDTAVILVGVQTEGKSPSEAMNQNSQQVSALLDALRNGGIASEDIQTASVSLSPQYSGQNTDQSQPQVTGYIAMNTVQVRVRNLSEVGDTLDSAVQGGSNLIQNVYFEVSNGSQAQQEALRQAINDAQSKAQFLASQANGQLGAILSIAEGNPTTFPLARGGAFQQAAVPIEPGTQAVYAQVQVTWVLVGGNTGFLPGTGGTASPTRSPAQTAAPTAAATTQAPTRTPAAATTTAPTSTPQPTSTVEVPRLGADDGTPELVDALEAAGATVSREGQISQPFFPVDGRLLRVNGAEVQVFQFENDTARKAVSDTISQSGEIAGTDLSAILGQTNFWAVGRIIVLYVGENQSTTNLITQVAGKPITKFG